MGGGCRQPRAQSPCPPPCTPYGWQWRHCHSHHRLSHAGHRPPKATSPCPAGPCPAGQARAGRRQHRGAGRRRQIPRGPGQGSSATGRGTADHPPHPPYLGVLRPTVMDTIETPKIDRLHRLGAVSLTVRAGGGEEMGQLTGGTVLPPLSWQALSRPFLPAAGTVSCSRCAGTHRMQRAVTRAHARWVSWLCGLHHRLQTDEPCGQRVEILQLSWARPARTMGSSTGTPNQPLTPPRQCRG